ncbi:MAG TPA: hypothetical protein VMT22_16810 [Terriglobales bacterium]|nr:hypothetical protein [Terriglobales bacterium]
MKRALIVAIAVLLLSPPVSAQAGPGQPGALRGVSPRGSVSRGWVHGSVPAYRYIYQVILIITFLTPLLS